MDVLSGIGEDGDSDASDFCTLTQHGSAPAASATTVRPVPAVVSAPTAPAAARAPARESKTRNLKRWAKLGVPGRSADRTKAEHFLVCERARAKKAEKRADAALDAVADAAHDAIKSNGRVADAVRGRRNVHSRGRQRANEYIRQLRNTGRRGRKSHRLTSLRDVEVAFDKTLRQRDVANSKRVSDKVVGQSRHACAELCRRGLLTELQ